MVLDTKACATSLKDARALVTRAIALIPDLTVNGAGVEWRSIRGLSREAAAAFQAERQAALYTDGVLQMVAACADWLSGKRLRKTFAPAHRTSYYYKHLVEAFRRGQGHADQYIRNGAFIAAAVGLGLDFKISGVNVRFKISEKEMPHAR